MVADVIERGALVSEIEGAGGRAIGRVTDVADPAAVAGMVAAALAAFGRIDIMVNNAAIFGRLELRPFEQIPSDEWDAVMRVNVRGSFECARAVAPHSPRRTNSRRVRCCMIGPPGRQSLPA